MSENRMWMGNAHVAGECKVESAAHAIAVYGSTNRGRQLLDCAHQALSHECKVVRIGMKRGDLVQVCASREEVFIAGDDERLRLSREPFNSFRQRPNTRSRQPICAVLGTQPQDANTAAFITMEVG